MCDNSTKGSVLKNKVEKILDCNFSKTGNGSQYLNTTGYASVKNLFGEKSGNVAIFSDVKPNIIKTSDKEKPFTLNNNVVFYVLYKDNNENRKLFRFKVPKGYKWDGASIPSWIQWGIGKNDEPEYAVASMVHDVMCEDHSKIGNNRKLSSSIFKALLMQNGVLFTFAKIMSWFVDLYQKFFANWSKKRKTQIALN